MLPFKDGAFKISTKTGCPIVPISLNNTAEIFEKHMPRIKKTHVVIEYGKPIYPDQLDKDTKRHIGDYIENIIRETIHKMRTWFKPIRILYFPSEVFSLSPHNIRLFPGSVLLYVTAGYPASIQHTRGVSGIPSHSFRTDRPL